MKRIVLETLLLIILTVILIVGIIAYTAQCAPVWGSISFGREIARICLGIR